MKGIFKVSGKNHICHRTTFNCALPVTNSSIIGDPHTTISYLFLHITVLVVNIFKNTYYYFIFYLTFFLTSNNVY